MNPAPQASASVIEKIKKLFALAQQDRNNSSAEADAAMTKAQELLAKYNLDIRVVKDAASADNQAAPDAAPPREKRQVNRSAMYRWQQEFWRELSTINYCMHWIVDVREEHPRRKGVFRRVKRHVILGSEANVTAVNMMGDYLTEVMERELPYPNQERLSSSALSWREGCAARLIERLQERVERMKREGFRAEDGTVVTALAVRDVHEKEYAANYDSQYGKGAYARMKARNAEYTRQAEERRQREEEEQARMLGSETPAQRAARETQEARAAAKQAARDARWWERHQRRQARVDARRDIAAYARGTKKAESVNLDSQVKE